MNILLIGGSKTLKESLLQMGRFREAKTCIKNTLRRFNIKESSSITSVHKERGLSKTGDNGEGRGGNVGAWNRDSIKFNETKLIEVFLSPGIIPSDISKLSS